MNSTACRLKVWQSGTKEQPRKARITSTERCDRAHRLLKRQYLAARKTKITTTHQKQYHRRPRLQRQKNAFSTELLSDNTRIAPARNRARLTWVQPMQICEQQRPFIRWGESRTRGRKNQSSKLTRSPGLEARTCLQHERLSANDAITRGRKRARFASMEPQAIQTNSEPLELLSKKRTS